VERVDDALKPDIMHWAAIYVSIHSFFRRRHHVDDVSSIAGSPHAPG
jgi:hypothetical protein